MEELHLTYHKNNKLKGIISINTSTFSNDFCNQMGCRSIARKNREKNIICHYCYSEKLEKIYENLEGKLKKNSKILSTTLINPFFINASLIRFHSFGEIINEIHMENFYNLAKFNKKTTFCLMTKRYNLVMKFPKLKNVIYIASSPVINEPITDKAVLAYFDKTFTVYEKEKGAKINCFGKSCVECQLCYKRTGEKDIRELLRK